MIIQAKMKKFGDRDYTQAKLNIPDDCEDLVKQYQIEMVEFPTQETMCIHFVKDVEDVYTHTIKRHHVPSLLKDGFKKAIHQLKQIEELKVIPNETERDPT